MKASLFLRKLLDARLSTGARDWFRTAAAEIADGASDARFAALVSLSSRHARRADLAPTEAERIQAQAVLEGWNPERWTILDALRTALLLASPGLAGDDGPARVEEAFRYADEGELCALYRALALLPGPERFLWRAGEGCRTNMRSVFEATCLDTPYPARHFDDLAFRQAVIKCLFVGAPLWRLHGLDGRLSAELARMALDLADERRSAGRPIPHELWLCLGPYGGARGLEALERELSHTGGDPRGRAAALVAFARSGDQGRLARVDAQGEPALVREALERASAGETSSASFRFLE